MVGTDAQPIQIYESQFPERRKYNRGWLLVSNAPAGSKDDALMSASICGIITPELTSLGCSAFDS